MKKMLNILLLISLIITMMAPVTGIYIHKLASTVFLLLNVIHVIIYRKKLTWKRWLLSAIILISFLSGLLAMILEQYPVALNVHRAISIGAICFLALHIYARRKSFYRQNY